MSQDGLPHWHWLLVVSSAPLVSSGVRVVDNLEGLDRLPEVLINEHKLSLVRLCSLYSQSF